MPSFWSYWSCSVFSTWAITLSFGAIYLCRSFFCKCLLELPASSTKYYSGFSVHDALHFSRAIGSQISDDLDAQKEALFSPLLFFLTDIWNVNTTSVPHITWKRKIRKTRHNQIWGLIGVGIEDFGVRFFSLESHWSSTLPLIKIRSQLFQQVHGGAIESFVVS